MRLRSWGGVLPRSARPGKVELPSCVIYCEDWLIIMIIIVIIILMIMIMIITII